LIEKSEEQKDLEEKLDTIEKSLKFLKWYGASLDKGTKKLSQNIEDNEDNQEINKLKQRLEKLRQEYNEYLQEWKIVKSKLDTLKNWVQDLQKSVDNAEFNTWVEYNPETWETKENELSQEKLQTITNEEFLKISPENRLQYITKNHIDAESIANWTVKDLEFTFTFDWKFNKELYMLTTAGQVLPEEVREVKLDWVTYNRKGLKWEFFTDWWRRLTIHEWTKIDNIKVWTEEEIKKLELEVEKKVNNFIENNPWMEKFQDIISEAYKRNIDPDFAILAFWDKVKDLSLLWLDRRALLEDMFTEYDRIKGNIPSVMNNSWDWLKVLILRQFWWEKWKEKASNLGISSDIIKQYESKYFASKLSLKNRAEILANVPANIKNAIEKVFPASEVENAILVAYWESGFDVNAYRDSSKNPWGWNDLWLFQINDKYHSYIRNYDWKNPEINAKIAYKIYKEAWNSWKPWYAARKIWLA
jgi:hypothetical protein